MSISPNQRRRGRSRDTGPDAGREPGQAGGQATTTETDALAGLRRAVADLDPKAFAACFSAVGWLRIPRPDGDIVLRGRAEIEWAGNEVRQQFAELSWTPSQRFLTTGQVVEEAVARSRMRATDAGTPDEIQVSMRMVAALDPAGGIGSLTLWVDWAALSDPRGVDSAHGAASALVAQARARDARGLRVIEADPTSELLLPAPPVVVPAQRTAASTRPPAPVMLWRRHRSTLAGAVMAVAAAAVIGWVSLSVLKPIADARLSAAKVQPGPSSTAAGVRPAATAPARSAAPRKVPVVKPTRTGTKPTVQDGEQFTLTSAVLFRTNSTELTATAQAKLQNIADRARGSRMSGNIQVNGYTDSDGSSASNVTLSQNRANAVADALARKLSGLPVKVTPQAFGEDDPVEPNTTAEGKQANRRVTIVLPEQR